MRSVSQWEPGSRWPTEHVSRGNRDRWSTWSVHGHYLRRAFVQAQFARTRHFENVFTFFKSSRSIFSIPSSWSTLDARVGEESLLLGARDKRRVSEETSVAGFVWPFFSEAAVFFFLCQITQYSDPMCVFTLKRKR